MYCLLSEFYRNVAKKISYWLPVSFFAAMAYAFSTVNRTISVDDLAWNFYFGSDLATLGDGRWALFLVKRIFSSPIFTPFTDRFLAVIFFILTAAVFSCILYYLNGRKQHVFPYVVFSSALITFPLIHEIWEYSGANLILSFSFLSLSLLFLFLLIHTSWTWKTTFVSSVVVAFAISGYESNAALYITLALIILFYQYGINQLNQSEKGKWFLDGLRYAASLILGLVFYFATIKLIPLVLNITPDNTYRGKTIFWGDGNQLRNLLATGVRYILSALTYPPITFFVLALVFFAIYICYHSLKARRWLPLILGCGLVVSLFAMGILQGAVMPYRIANSLSFFTAFAFYLASESCVNCPPKGLKTVTACILLLIIWQQSVYMNHVLALNNQRSDNEAAVVQQIGYQLKSQFDEKPVIFVGRYDMGSWITEKTKPTENSWGTQVLSRIYEIFSSSTSGTMSGGSVSDSIIMHGMESNVNSALNWSTVAWDSQNMMKEYFSYYGYDISLVQPYSEAVCNEALETSRHNKLRPFEIMDAGNYLIVCLGDIS